MDFFAAQADAHARTRVLLIAYIAAVAAVVIGVTLILMYGYVFARTSIWLSTPYTERILGHPGLTLLIGFSVLAIILGASAHRTAQLAGGGGAAATALGAVHVTRESDDPRARRLLNVVEEMAIASGVPVPEVYVLEGESGINAFAAGFSPADAAITVTRGALDRLNRAELAGVIGHEFSHLLNGDMRLNTRLAGPLFGLLIIAHVARFIVRDLRGPFRAAPAFAVAAFVMVLGYLGVLVGRLLQAAICRQREFLADASSVQFTRDNTALRDALARIARTPEGSAMQTVDNEELAHLFIAPAAERLFATHPPLATRIQRLDPRYDLSVLDEIDDSPPDPEAVPDTASSAAGGRSRATTGLAAGFGAGPTKTPALSARIGNPGLTEIAHAAALRAALPSVVESALARPASAACLWLAITLSSTETVRTAQLKRITAGEGEPVARAAEALGRAVRALPAVQYLPLLQRALPVLKGLPREHRAALAALTRDLTRLDGGTSVLHYLVGALATRYLSDQMQPVRTPGTRSLDDCKAELGTLFAIVATAGGDSPVDARRAYERGLSSLLPRDRPDYAMPPAAGWAAALDDALARLVELRPAAKELLVDGLDLTILHDGFIRPEETELLRAVCAVLQCPLPPLLPLAEVA
jgi:Zn-dependent protease with chaperone function